ncbi:MAG: hypothetical protein BWY77_00883 [bacterium ADurb.Bin431]|nr:MAG: hypothetical protein BWY77_00883 [bacterium ADurb.Bin431]
MAGDHHGYPRGEAEFGCGGGQKRAGNGARLGQRWEPGRIQSRQGKQLLRKGAAALVGQHRGPGHGDIGQPFPGESVDEEGGHHGVIVHSLQHPWPVFAEPEQPEKGVERVGLQPGDAEKTERIDRGGDLLLDGAGAAALPGDDRVEQGAVLMDRGSIHPEGRHGDGSDAGLWRAGKELTGAGAKTRPDLLLVPDQASRPAGIRVNRIGAAGRGKQPSPGINQNSPHIGGPAVKHERGWFSRTHRSAVPPSGRRR